MSSRSLSGRLALVTGAGRGIGRGTAVRLAEAGCDTILLARSEPHLRETADLVEKAGRRAFVFPFDLSDTDGLETAFRRMADEFGPPDILVNNAGINLRAPALELPLDDFRLNIRVNLEALFILSREFAGRLVQIHRPGAIVNIASLMSEAARPTTAAYTASKGAVKQLTKALAVEWAEFGIRVNAVGPGYIETEMTRPLKENPEFDRWVLSRTPLRRWGTPGDIAEAVVFLVSDAASFITGQVLYVDGGFLAAL